MHLYDEQAIARDDLVESELLRLSFWNAYSSDKGRICAGNSPNCSARALASSGNLHISTWGTLYSPLGYKQS
jgi:hypothetical protein